MTITHDRGLLIAEKFWSLSPNYAVTTHLPPLVCNLCIDKKPRRCLIFQGVLGVDGILAATAIYALV